MSGDHHVLIGSATICSHFSWCHKCVFEPLIIFWVQPMSISLSLRDTDIFVCVIAHRVTARVYRQHAARPDINTSNTTNIHIVSKSISVESMHDVSSQPPAQLLHYVLIAIVCCTQEYRHQRKCTTHIRLTQKQPHTHIIWNTCFVPLIRLARTSRHYARAHGTNTISMPVRSLTVDKHFWMEHAHTKTHTGTH